jgi:hypothetical protein
MDYPTLKILHLTERKALMKFPAIDRMRTDLFSKADFVSPAGHKDSKTHQDGGHKLNE